MENLEKKSSVRQVIRDMVFEGENLPEEYLNTLIETNNDESWNVLVEYIKRHITQLPDVISHINFDWRLDSFDDYERMKEKIEHLLEGKDGIIDGNKCDKVKSLLQNIFEMKRKSKPQS